jgi:Trypsin
VAGTESQCGPTDDRVPSFEPARARLLNIGCTASIYNEQSCFITAGHCLSSPSLVNVVEFNVPPSLPNGNLVHPAPADQYVPTSERMFINGGIGNDWGLFKVFPNTQTGLLPFAAQGAMLTLATSVPALGTTLRIVGYGIDGGTANQTQQEHSGPLTAVSANALNYQVDTEGGNSGSAVTRASDDVIIGIHTHAGCNTGGGGANAGTAITHPGLQSALQSFCTATAGVGCADINRMVGRCNATSGRVQIIVRMTDTSHAGQSMVATVDGSPVNLPINFGGGRFGFAQGNFGGGVHTISLVDPANCTNVPDLQLSCP